MFYKLSGGGLEEISAERWPEAQVVLVSNGYVERKTETHGDWHGITDQFWNDMLENNDVRFESHVDFDLICIPDFMNKESDPVDRKNPLENPLYILLDKKQMVIVTHARERFADYLGELYNHVRELTEGYIIFHILDSLLEHEEERIEELEQRVVDWEEEDIDFDSDDYVSRIVRLRRHLLLLKHFYEHLRRTIAYIADNENQLLDERTVKRMTILENRSLSMVEDIQVLREEVAQLKEGYQAQRDLSMNKTMQFLTVVTTIFTPLTLVAGWYGMNFKMPEYEHAIAYPILIVLSILLIIGGVWLFKKKKWL